MSLIVDGVPYDVPGITTRNWTQDDRARTVPAVRRPRHVGELVRAATMHTTQGLRTLPGDVRAGGGRPGRALATIRFWNARATLPRDDPRHRIASAHLVVDRDGTVYQTADLIREVAYHAGSVNGWTWGAELGQESRPIPGTTHRTGILYRATLEALAHVAEWFASTWAPEHGLEVARTFPGDDGGTWDDRFTGERRIRAGGFGAFGHCNVSPRSHRGPGDPGPWIFSELVSLGWHGAPVPR